MGYRNFKGVAFPLLRCPPDTSRCPPQFLPSLKHVEPLTHHRMETARAFRFYIVILGPCSC